MRAVFCNTSPLQYLHQIGQLDILPALFEEVQVAEAVVTELAEGVRLRVSLPDIDQLPWVMRRRVPAHASPPPDLGRGEAETIALGCLDPEALVILDDGGARRTAKALGLSVTGTVGVLLLAKQSGHIAAIGPSLDELASLEFRLSARIRRTVLTRAGESESVAPTVFRSQEPW